MAEVADPQRVASPEAQLDAEGLDRGVSFLGLLWSSEGSIIGSGWLFGALTAATIAGPSALIGWFAASFIVILLALVHAELGGLFPVSGGTSRFPHYAFGSLAGATFGWASYLQASTVAPIEVLAAIQYLSRVTGPSSSTSTGTLSGRHHRGGHPDGVLRVREPGRDPVAGTGQQRDHLVEGADPGPDDRRAPRHPLSREQLQLRRRLLRTRRRGQEHPDRDPDRRHRVRPARLRTGGSAGGRGGHPERDLPRAVILSILIGAAIYILLQVAFIGAIDPEAC